MLQDGVLQRYETFVAAATVGSHAHASKDGFRQRDVRFLVELFSNWLESHIGVQTLPVQGTQVLRYLEQLIRDGYLRKLLRKKVPHYRLTRIGLIELLSRMVERKSHYRPEEFFFTYYFIKGYKPRIAELVAEEGRQFPTALRLELESLLDYGALLHREKQRIKRELRKLNERISDGKQSIALARREQTLGTPHEQIIMEIQRRFPYDLNSQKPLTELFREIPAPYRIWELTEGTERRVEDLWSPLSRMLAGYLAELERLK